MSNLDLNAAKRIMYMLSNFYPERMGQCLIVSAPIIFSAAWAVIRPWLWRRTQTKVQFCKAEELGRWIAPAALPSFWGGLDQTIYSSRSLSPSAPPPVLLCAVALSLALQHVTLSLVALALAHMCALGFGRALPCTMCGQALPRSSLSRFNWCQACRMGCGPFVPPCFLLLPLFPHSPFLLCAYGGWVCFGACVRGRGNRDLDEGAAQKA